MMKIIKSPNDRSLAVGTKIFLAGSIEMGASIDWQQIVSDRLKNFHITLFTFFNPRRENWDPTWVQSIENHKFVEQVNWELDALEEADIIFMYFDPNTKSPISLLEFGMYIRNKMMVVVCPQGFWRRGNLEVCCEKFGVDLFDNIDDGIERLSNLLIDSDSNQ